MMNATFVGLLFLRLARGSSIATQIVFSDKACIRCVRGRFFLLLQVPGWVRSGARQPSGSGGFPGQRAAGRREVVVDRAAAQKRPN